MPSEVDAAHEENDLVSQTLLEFQTLAERMRKQTARSITRAAELVHLAIKSGNKVLACGNGGSAAEAQHFIAELVGRFLTERDPLAGIALTVDTLSFDCRRK